MAPVARGQHHPQLSHQLPVHGRLGERGRVHDPHARCQRRGGGGAVQRPHGVIACPQALEGRRIVDALDEAVNARARYEVPLELEVPKRGVGFEGSRESFDAVVVDFAVAQIQSLEGVVPFQRRRDGRGSHGAHFICEEG